MDTYAQIKSLAARVDALEAKPHPGADPEVGGILADMDIVLQELKVQADEVRARLDEIAADLAEAEAPMDFSTETLRQVVDDAFEEDED